MASDSSKASVVFILAALVGIGTATYFFLRARRNAEPGQRLDEMLDDFSSKAAELEALLLEEGQSAPATA